MVPADPGPDEGPDDPSDRPPAGGEARVEIGIIDGLGQVAAADWDALTTGHDPFTRHDFLSALEESGSVGGRSGWQPAHVLVRQEGRLVGACPAYVKGHSYGEYIFDWGWARAAQQAGIAYYPKVVSAVPFTPATGRRVLVAPGASEALVLEAVTAGLQHLADAVDGSSFHWLFCTGAEHAALSRHPSLTGRMTHQYHWENLEYESFDHWLSTFRSKARKEARRERRRAREACDVVHVLRGSELGPREWSALRGFYEDTTSRKWGQAYLTPEWFDVARTSLQDTALAWLAEHEGRYVAGALCFQEGQHLYGRYWGCLPDYSALHFELCYHGPVEACITNGWTRFEAGAQGQHKIQRGLMPRPTWSVHWLRHPGLARAVDEANRQEARLVAREMEALAAHGPFKREHEG